MEVLGLSNRLRMFSDGKGLVAFIETTLNSIENSHLDGTVQTPVALLLVDINMPAMTGMECVKDIKYQFMELNQRLK